MQTNKNALLEIIPKLFEEDEILSEELPKLVNEAINNMLNSNEVSGKEDEKAYSDLLKGINKVYGKDSFSTQLYKLYHMEHLASCLVLL